MSKRANILKLATKISLESMTYTGVTYTDPEYRILDPIVDDDMCAIMMHMRLETPRTAAEIARRAKRSEAFAREQIDKLLRAGIIRLRSMGEEMGYYYPIWVPGIMEGIMSNRAQADKYPVLGECFEEYTRRRIEVLAPFLGRGMSFMRVMPVMTAIENNSHTASYDELSTLIEKATAISVGPCSCRRSRRLMGEGCGHLEEDMCIYLNDNALNYSKYGEHRLIDKAEAYEILKRAEDNGLVHEINQAPGFEDASAICNCCGCGCFSLRIAEYFRKPEGMRSNYKAVVEREKCVACGQCVENCQTNALHLGQKLCESRPAERSDPHSAEKSSILNKATYNKDFRTNRTDVAASGTSPCKAACPAHIPVQGYIKLASEGRWSEALELIKKENPFPAVCGRICNKACEDVCTRARVDEAIAIDDIKKLIAEKDLHAETRFVPKLLNQTGKPYSEKIAVIGAGPAGLSCAYYLAVKGYGVTVFEKEQQLGGMLTLGIPSFRLEKDVLQAEIEILRELGVCFRTAVTVGKDLTLDELRAEGYRAFYLGIGASKGSALRCKGADLPGVMTGIDFLRRVNLSEQVEIGKHVAVIGGGNVAIDVARTAVRLGAQSVTVLYRRGREEMPAAAEEVREAEAEGVSFRFLCSPAEISGEGRAERLMLEEMELCALDAQGRKQAVGTGRYSFLEADTVISAIGQTIEAAGFGLKLGPKGNVLVDPVTYQSSVQDVFAGGDVVTGPKFAIDAIAAGKEAAVSIHRFVHEGQTLTLGRDRRDYRALDTQNVLIAIQNFDNTPRQHAYDGSAEEMKKTFRDLRGVLSEEQLQKEAARCLGCGAVEVDDYMCIGCGICTTKCKFDAIHLERVSDYCGVPYYRELSHILGNVPSAVGKAAYNRIKIGRK